MVYNKYSVSQFYRAWFEEDFSEISKEDFETCKSEFIDTAELYQNEDFDKVAYTYFINNRVNSISIFIQAQREFIKEFEQPCEVYFPFIKKFGHNLSWNGNKKDFEKSLFLIEQKEKKYKTILKTEINTLKNKSVKKEKDSQKMSSESFLQTLISLGKIGYNFDEDKTTVQRLALIIKQQKQELK